MTGKPHQKKTKKHDNRFPPIKHMGRKHGVCLCPTFASTPSPCHHRDHVLALPLACHPAARPPAPVGAIFSVCLGPRCFSWWLTSSTSESKYGTPSTLGAADCVAVAEAATPDQGAACAFAMASRYMGSAWIGEVRVLVLCLLRFGLDLLLAVAGVCCAAPSPPGYEHV